MTNARDAEDWVDPEADVRRKEKQEAETIRYVAQLNKNWQKAHAKRAAKIEAELRKEFPQARFDERLIMGLIGHDIGLAEVLGDAEIQLARRIAMMVDNAKVVLALAKALRETAACRGATERRLQELMQTRSVLQGQQKLAQVVPLRRVA